MPSPFRRPRRGEPDAQPRATFGQLLPYLLEHRGILSVAIALSIVSAALNLVQPLLVGDLIGRVGTEDSMATPLVVLAIVVVAGSLLLAWQHYLLQRTGTAVVFSTRRKLIARLLRLPIREFDARRTGDLVSRVGTDTTLLYAVLTQGLINAASSVLVIVGATIAMLIIDPPLLLTIVGVVVVAALLVVLFFGRIRAASAEQQARVGDLASGVERAIGAIRTIRTAGATEREEQSVTADAQAAYRAGLRVARASAFVLPIAGLALQLAIIVVLGIGGLRLATGEIDAANLVQFVMFLFLMIMPLGNLFGAVTSVGEALGALGRIQEILDLEPEDAHDRPTATESADSTIAVELRHVSFAYPTAASSDDARPVLDDVSFAVPRGARVALVGPSGAGKSTVLSLLERFYDPTGGAVLVGGTDLRDLPRAAVRAQFGYVEQDAPTLAGTLADNLRLASPGASDAAVDEALRAVNLGTVLDRSSAGINTVVGEDGVLLSGGERQRLAVARALLQDAPVLLLDESTSSLDGRNEQLMREALDEAAHGRTMLVIAHRLSTVIDSDLIVVLEEGRVIGSGRHDELVDTVPLYRELAKRQLLVTED